MLNCNSWTKRKILAKNPRQTNDRAWSCQVAAFYCIWKRTPEGTDGNAAFRSEKGTLESMLTPMHSAWKMSDHLSGPRPGCGLVFDPALTAAGAGRFLARIRQVTRSDLDCPQMQVPFFLFFSKTGVCKEMTLKCKKAAWRCSQEPCKANVWQ